MMARRERGRWRRRERKRMRRGRESACGEFGG